MDAIIALQVHPEFMDRAANMPAEQFTELARFRETPIGLYRDPNEEDLWTLDIGLDRYIIRGLAAYVREVTDAEDGPGEMEVVD